MLMKFRIFLCAALVCALLVCAAAPAAAGSASDFAERYGPLLADGLDDLADWLDDQTATLAPALRETLRDADTDELFSDLRELIGETEGLDDDALRARIVEVTEAHGIHLVERQVTQLMRVCRATEKLDAAGLRERTEKLGDLLSDPPGGLRGVWESVVGAVRSAGRWLADTVGGWFK